MTVNFIDAWLAYTEDTEPPKIYHRWCALSAVGALLGRNFHIPFGHSRIFPNLYCMLVGKAGTRKSTAIKTIRKLVASAGYEFFSADKTTKEKFLLDLEGELGDDDPTKKPSAQEVYDKITATNLWGDVEPTDPKEVFIVADEWNEFARPGDTEFYTTLGNLWDWDDDKRPFRQRVKNSKSVSIFQPTVGILGGTTPEKFAEAFPPSIIGGGFLSRMLLIYGETSGRKFTFPPQPEEEQTQAIVTAIQHIRGTTFGAASIDDGAKKSLDKIYRHWKPIDDVRFESYSNRRFTQLLKLCLILSASIGERAITEKIVVEANTYLSAAERMMPSALGQFGKSKTSDVAHKIMAVLEKSNKPVNVRELWRHVHTDLDKMTQLGDITQSLLQAEKIQYVNGKGWLPLRTVQKDPEFVDWKFLTEEERMML